MKAKSKKLYSVEDPLRIKKRQPVWDKRQYDRQEWWAKGYEQGKKDQAKMDEHELNQYRRILTICYEGD